MRKSTLNLVTSLRGKLLEFPGIVNRLEKKDISFLHHLQSWMVKSEEILSTYNLSEAAELAGLRSKIIAAKYADERTSSTKKLQLKIAAEALYDIQHIVLKTVTPFEAKVTECRELARQLLLIVSQTKSIKYNSNLPFDNLVTAIWQFIVSNEQLKPGAVKLKTVLPVNDIYLLIAEEINLEDF